MRITSQQLRRIIREEAQRINEATSRKSSGPSTDELRSKSAKLWFKYRDHGGRPTKAEQEVLQSAYYADATQ